MVVPHIYPQRYLTYKCCLCVFCTFQSAQCFLRHHIRLKQVIFDLDLVSHKHLVLAVGECLRRASDLLREIKA